MFDTLKCLFAGFAGQLKAAGEARRLVWLLLFTFLAGWLATAFAGWISWPSYRGSIAYLPGADLIATFFTGGIAGFLYFALAYLSGFAVERWKGTDAAARNYTALGARVFAVAAALFMVVDLYMNYQGTTHRAKEAAGNVATFTYQTPPDRARQIDKAQVTLEKLQAGQIGGYGWRNPKDGIYYLNNSGKRYQRQLSAQIERLQTADSTDRAAALADVEALNADRAETESLAKDALKNAVYGVYVLVLLLCIVQAYIVETIQEALGQSWTAPKPSAATTGTRAAATRQTGNPSKTVSVPLEGQAIGKASQTEKTSKTDSQRTCPNCGNPVIGRRNKVYCSETCRQTAWEQRNGKQLRRGRKTSNA